MANATFGEMHVQLMVALEGGANAAAIGKLAVGLAPKTEFEMMQARSLLRLSMEREVDVFQVVLDAMGKEVILPMALTEPSALHDAIAKERKGAAMAVMERMRKEAPFKLSSRPLQALFQSKLIEDEEVVEAVVSVMPADAFMPQGPGNETADLLIQALWCHNHIEHGGRALELCLEYGPPMEERLRGQERFCYVNYAADYCEPAVVQKMHDLVPLLPDGSGRRGEVADYAIALKCAALNRYSSTSAFEIIEFLVEQGGCSALDECDATIVRTLPTEESLEWVITRAPHLLEAACKADEFLAFLINSPLSCCLMELLVEFVDVKAIGGLMRQGMPAWSRKRRGREGWRWKLEVLHAGVPECMDHLRWPWLMAAIKDKAYRDVEYMLGMCGREHLARQNKKGDRAYDLAARDEEFPRELLGRLKVVTKGAYG